MAAKTHKELKEEYKMMKLPAGVYQIRNLQNGKVLIGSTLNLNAAWNSNRFQLEMSSHRNKDLLAEWDTFGAENFIFEILEEIVPEENPAQDLRAEVKALEAMYFEELKPYGERGYNSLPK